MLKCFRILTTMQHCVLKVLREAQLPCTLQEVIAISNQPEVREGLLDSIDPECGEFPTLIDSFIPSSFEYPQHRFSLRNNKFRF